jgi:HD superfamily phosphohydrolase
MEVRDPLHGAIVLVDAEVAVVDHPFVQRLRGIKQMGFSELPFPGAVHTRYAHSLGAMDLAGRAFDNVFRKDPFEDAAARRRFRDVVRIAALCHDLGHAPFSHCTEFAMPPLRSLGIGAYAPAAVADRLDHTASHEDYTVGVLTKSSLSGTIARNFPFTGAHVAALVSREVDPADDFFVLRGRNYRRVLSQLISSELDIDRLDYLVRDSYFSGARYGEIDLNWLISNLGWHLDDDGNVSLLLDQRAVYAFDDFLISRYHMFMSVYFHHKSVVYEEMLKRHFAGPQRTWQFPAEIEAYLPLDDVAMHSYLRAAGCEWARRIVERRPYRRVLERHGHSHEVDLTADRARLDEAGIDHLAAGSTGKLSRYSAMGKKRETAPPIWVADHSPGSRKPLGPLESATAIFARYQEARHIARLYVHEDDEAAARKLLG